ncbi:MAG: DUF3450 family protein [Alphaproteobacteria bacterium]|nr:DUF3450 family protein [Alphaproteobacteria bacterium]
MRTSVRSLMVAVAVWSALPARAEDAAQLARQLARLRGEVEQLSETLELEQEALRSDLRSFELRKAELEARIRQEELQLGEVERQVEAQREVLASDDVAGAVLTPVVSEALAGLRVRVEGGLPYRVGERLAAVDGLADQVGAGTLDVRKALGRSWQLVEDELRLTRENVLDRQVIVLDGEERLVDVARLGMVAIFFRTDDERVGRAVREGAGWRWVELTDAGDVTLLLELFDALTKQVRVGWFDLPWALPEVTR